MAMKVQGQLLPVLSMHGAPTTLSLSAVSASVAIPASIPTSDSVRVWSSVDSFIQFGVGSATATTSSHPLTAKVPEIFQLDGDTFVAGIVSSGTGTLFVSPLT